MGKLTDSVVVVTGASSGIGCATALAFAGKGAKVVLAARRREPLEAAAQECREAGAADALAVPTDMTDPEAVERLAATAVDCFGGIDVWVNNAAVTVFAPFADLPLEDFRRVRMSRVPWNFGDGPTGDQAAASSLVGVTAGTVWSSAARRAGRYRCPLTRRNCLRASFMPAAIQRSTIWPSCQRLTLAA
jgi:hypothetical protein